MPAVRTRLFGWTPSSVNDSNVEVITPQRPFVPSPPLSTLPLLADPIPTFPPQTISLPRAIGTPKEHTHDAPSPPMSTSPNLATRSGSPEHIRRPRNSFIIFRCQFAREHSKSKSEDAADMASEKSMSARASEAWHQLSAEEKKVYDDLALLEKAEHARKNPDYRFKPKKRQSESAKKRGQLQVPSSVGPRRRTTSTHSLARTPSPPLSPVLEAVISLPVLDQYSSSPVHSQVEAVSMVDPAVKMARRRSASAPQPYKPFEPSPVYPMLPRQEPRSRSIVARPITLPHNRVDYTRAEYSTVAVPRPIPPSFSTPELSMGFEGTAPYYVQGTMAPYASADQLPSSHQTNSQYISPLAAVANTLSGWDSDFTATPATTPQAPSSPVDGPQIWQTPFASSSTSSISPSISPSTSSDLSKTSSNIRSPYPAYPFNDAPIQQITDSYLAPSLCSYESLFQAGPPPYQEVDCSQALQEYDLGLSERLGSGSPFFFTDSASELNAVDPNGSYDFDLNSFLNSL